jgi:AAA domain/DnaB-like helicase N terminal domain
MAHKNGDNGTLPFSDDAEKGVLCSLLLALNDVAKLCAERLEPGAFYVPAHRIIYELLLEFAQTGRPIQFPLIKQTLLDRAQLEEAGGAQLLSDLFDFVPTPDAASYYIEGVLKKYQARRLYLLGDKLVAKHHNHDDHENQEAEVDALLAEAEAELAEISKIKASELLIESGADMVSADLELPPELIIGVLHKTLKGQLAGASKSMKSWALIHLAISVSLGRQWWGFKTTRGRVLFLNLEIPRPFFAQRVRDVVEAMGVGLDPATFSVVHLRGAELSKPESWERLLTEITRRGPWDLLIFDPIYKFLGRRDENSATDVTQIVMSLERAAELTGASVMYSHHYAKGSAAGKESTDRMSGSGVWMRDPDTYLAMTPHKVDGCFTIEPTLRNLPPVEPFVVQWNHPLFERAAGLDPDQLRQPKKLGSSAKYKPEQIVEILGDKDLKTAELQKLVMSETGMSRAKFFELLREAEQRRLIVKDGQSNTWERSRRPTR